MNNQTKVTNENGELLKAGCVVINDKNEVLLVAELGKEKWEFPKGHVDPGETVEQAAVREVQEETGYSVQLLRRLSDVTYTNRRTGEPIRVAMFLAKPIGMLHEAEPQTRSRWIALEAVRDAVYYTDMKGLVGEITQTA